MFIIPLSTKKVINPITKNSTIIKRGVATIGNYDGIHLGHRKIISQLVDRAKKTQSHSMVISFEPTASMHFARVKGKPLLSLSCLRVKVDILSELGVDYLVLLAPSPSLLAVTAECFVERFLIDELSITQLLVGKDFRFGYQRMGNTDLLSRYSEFNLIVISDYFYESDFPDKDKLIRHDRVSSSMIRRLLDSGDIVAANTLLNRPLCGFGKVVRGQGIGTTLGYPTLNLVGKSLQHWPLGVYIAEVTIEGKSYRSALSIGRRNTIVKNGSVVVEGHLLDTKGDFYGKWCKIQLLGKIRDQQQYRNREELISAIKNDCMLTKKWVE